VHAVVQRLNTIKTNLSNSSCGPKISGSFQASFPIETIPSRAMLERKIRTRLFWTARIDLIRFCLKRPVFRPGPPKIIWAQENPSLFSTIIVRPDRDPVCSYYSPACGPLSPRRITHLNVVWTATVVTRLSLILSNIRFRNQSTRVDRTDDNIIILQYSLV